MAKLKEQLLGVMDQKNHWGWEFLSHKGLSKAQLLVHFQQEYETFVRDFPLLLARVLGRMSSDSETLKRELAENIYEEQAGGLSLKWSKGKSHPELFLHMMKGMGYQPKSFQSIELLPTSLAYRCFLDKVSLLDDWRVGAAVLTLFVEGSSKDRERIKSGYKETAALASKIKNHGLVKHYGLPLQYADLIRVHHAVEGGHRKSAWETLLKNIPSHQEDLIVKRMNEALDLWLLFRDGVCLEMDLEPKDLQYEIR